MQMTAAAAVAVAVAVAVAAAKAAAERVSGEVLPLPWALFIRDPIDPELKPFC